MVTLMKRSIASLLAAIVVLCLTGVAMAADKIAVLSTSFVLERKFKLLEESARHEGIELVWSMVDREGEAGVKRVLDGARLAIVDAPRADDRAQIERFAGKPLREGNIPTLNIIVFARPAQFNAVNLDGAIAQRLYEYYVGGTAANHERLAKYLKVWMAGGDAASVEPPVPLPNGGIYHGDNDRIFETLPEYLAWWEKRNGSWSGKPVIAMEMSSSYISDGQTRKLDETIAAIEKHGAVPLVFYRSSRVARAAAEGRTNSSAMARAEGGRPEGAPSGRPPATEGKPEGMPSGRPQRSDDRPEGRPSGRPQTVEGRPEGMPSGRPQADGNTQARPVAVAEDGFPNPKEGRPEELNEPLITLYGKLLPNVLFVNTFIGGGPDKRKSWHQAMGIPVIYTLSYRDGDRAAFMKDKAGVSTFMLPFTLTMSEYIGMQDPVMVYTNEGGELRAIPEQLDLLVGKAVNLARLQTTANAKKHVALLFWNTPPGEKNMGASHLNVPRSIERLITQLKTEGYTFDQASEQQIIDAAAQMLRPRYRHGAVEELMSTPHWAFVPLDAYKRWYATLPDSVRADVEQYWGVPEKSTLIVKHNGIDGFVVPRMQLGNLTVMPQPPRGEMGDDEDEKKLFHDVKVPLSHSYMAAYLWVREEFKADAIVHFGTHGSQEWTPGKERGLWAFDYPNILVGNVPIIYPYIVDNISEAIHVKRRGRGVIVSHQTPAFAPAGLSDDFVRINDMIREYRTVDDGPVKEKNRAAIIKQAVKMNIHKDLKLTAEDLERKFDTALRDIETYLEDLGSAQQPLGLHTFGEGAEKAHLVSNVMQMLGQPLYEATGVKNAREAFRGDYKQLQQTAPYRFVEEWVFSNRPLTEQADERLRALAEKGRKYAIALNAEWETKSVVKGLAARWINPSYGGDPIRNPDALPTGRNMYGFDPSRVPTKAAYEAGREAIEDLIKTHKANTGKFPEKLAFTLWSTETMRHLGMLEAQVMAAMGVRPVWDEGGRVIGMEVIPLKELGRPRIDPVISITGLYRDQFPNVMERLNEALVMVAALEEGEDVNRIRANTARIQANLEKKGIKPELARNYALTRIFSNESGNYGTNLPKATLASDKWEEKDGKLANVYLLRMSWGYGPDVSQWSQKLHDASGTEVNVYAEQLRGTDAAVFSRSSNLKGLLDRDHPFEYLGGISLAVRHLDGKSPQLYISNMRDPAKAKLETAEKFLANELRAVYQHPRWMAEMQKEGYSGTLSMLNTVNNFWGWQAMDRNIVRDDQWQEFHETYVKDRYKLGMRDWFEKNNPTALAQITERMLEAVRKDYWKADEQTRRELVQVYQELAAKYDVQTANETFKTYVAEQAKGFGLNAQLTPAKAAAPSEPSAPQATAAQPQPVQGQQLTEVKKDQPLAGLIWSYAWLLVAVVVAGMLWQAWQARASRK
jgi:cobaltochelatase CobN